MCQEHLQPKQRQEQRLALRKGVRMKFDAFCSKFGGIGKLPGGLCALEGTIRQIMIQSCWDGVVDAGKWEC